MGNTPETYPQVDLFTDGACLGNPGPGGWAFILRHAASGQTKEGAGGEHHTTNNRMEITAAIRGLEALRVPSEVTLYSDSLYVVKAVREWMERWRALGWRKTPRAKELVKNADLWRRLHGVAQVHRVTPKWVRGHAGHVENERCDQLANAEATKVAALPAPPAPPPDTSGQLFGDP